MKTETLTIDARLDVKAADNGESDNKEILQPGHSVNAEIVRQLDANHNPWQEICS